MKQCYHTFFLRMGPNWKYLLGFKFDSTTFFFGFREFRLKAISRTASDAHFAIKNMNGAMEWSLFRESILNKNFLSCYKGTKIAKRISWKCRCTKIKMLLQKDFDHIAWNGSKHCNNKKIFTSLHFPVIFVSIAWLKTPACLPWMKHLVLMGTHSVLGKQMVWTYSVKLASDSSLIKAMSDSGMMRERAIRMT